MPKKTVVSCKEQELIPDALHPDVWSREYDNKKLIKWDRSWNDGRWGYWTNFRIGAEWLSSEQAIVVTPKRDMENIDWPAMFLRCFETEEGCEDGLGSIYGIDLESPQIDDTTLQSVLTPLMVVHFVLAVRRVVRRGLRCGPVVHEDDLPKVRGKINFVQNLRRNVIAGRADRVFCRYCENSVDTPENRLIKRALVFAQRMCRRMRSQGSRSSEELQARLAQCLVAFERVGEVVSSSEVLHPKRNKLYREYDAAVRLALLILRRYDNSVDRMEGVTNSIPPFWIDMSLLYEHYVLGLLREAYGDKIVYQAGVKTGYPDFLFVDPPASQILDTKYKPRYEGGCPCTDDIRQLSAYARDRSLLRKLGMSVADQDCTIVPCVVIYPHEKGSGPATRFDGCRTPMQQQKSRDVDELVEFSLLQVDLPTLR